MNLETIISLLALFGIGGVTGGYFNHLFEKRKDIQMLNE